MRRVHVNTQSNFLKWDFKNEAKQSRLNQNPTYKDPARRDPTVAKTILLCGFILILLYELTLILLYGFNLSVCTEPLYRRLWARYPVFKYDLPDQRKFEKKVRHLEMHQPIEAVFRAVIQI
jgi:hypothetical protein